MDRIRQVACITVLLWSFAAMGKGEKDVHVYGLGMSSCGALIQAFRHDSPNTALNHDGRTFPTTSHAYQQWLAGFVTSYNVHGPSLGALGQSTDIVGLMEWVHSYCQKNPTDLVAQAASKMVLSLDKK